jgi:HrpA-like RNA helicase
MINENAVPLASPSPPRVGVIRSEKKIQALDFWMRNPYYLANEIMNDYEAKQSSDDLDIAGDILTDEEPNFRTNEMIRFWYGAYEPVDNWLSALYAYELVDIDNPSQGNRTDFYSTEKGIEKAQHLIEKCNQFKWYKHRAQLIARRYSHLTGSELKKRQYLTPEYENTQWGNAIPSIRKEVLRRYEVLSND